MIGAFLAAVGNLITEWDLFILSYFTIVRNVPLNYNNYACV